MEERREESRRPEAYSSPVAAEFAALIQARERNELSLPSPSLSLTQAHSLCLFGSFASSISIDSSLRRQWSLGGRTPAAAVVQLAALAQHLHVAYSQPIETRRAKGS